VDTKVFIGGGITYIVQGFHMSLLANGLMHRLFEKYGAFGPNVILAFARNTGAPAVWNAAEGSVGMAESLNLDLERYCEGTELGVYSDDGWYRLNFTQLSGEDQAEVHISQSMWWSRVAPRMKRAEGVDETYGAPVRILSHGRDSLGGVQGVLAAGPVGDLGFIQLAHLEPPDDERLRFIDCECYMGDNVDGYQEWVPLRRQMVAIMPREGKSPIVFPLTRDGRFNEFALPFVLEGENIELCLAHTMREVLAAMRWLPVWTGSNGGT